MNILGFSTLNTQMGNSSLFRSASQRTSWISGKHTFTVSTWTWAQSLKITVTKHTRAASERLLPPSLPDECQIHTDTGRVWLSFAFLQSKFHPFLSRRSFYSPKLSETSTTLTSIRNWNHIHKCKPTTPAWDTREHQHWLPSGYRSWRELLQLRECQWKGRLIHMRWRTMKKNHNTEQNKSQMSWEMT